MTIAGQIAINTRMIRRTVKLTCGMRSQTGRRLTAMVWPSAGLAPCVIICPISETPGARSETRPSPRTLRTGAALLAATWLQLVNECLRDYTAVWSFFAIQIRVSPGGSHSMWPSTSGSYRSYSTTREDPVAGLGPDKGYVFARPHFI